MLNRINKKKVHKRTPEEKVKIKKVQNFDELIILLERASY